MKKIMMLLSAMLLASCVAGEFTDERNRMHEVNSDKEICDKNPSRCISGIAW